MLQIHLARVGKKNQPQFRIVVADHQRPVNTNFIEVLGAYHPKSKDNKVQSLKQERLLYWIKLGAHLTPRIAIILKPYIETVPEFIKKEIKKTEKIIAYRKAMPKKEEKLKEEKPAAKPTPKIEKPEVKKAPVKVEDKKSTGKTGVSAKAEDKKPAVAKAPKKTETPKTPAKPVIAKKEEARKPESSKKEEKKTESKPKEAIKK